ncbi:putative quinol monooxygenase [Corynebacterium pacaense]|uniref:putative quinol monooxygenase n=1 Tax=Corynebacterium pacaense TaxID=1816684 RepID=UPI0009B9D2C5|nr:putative quinol monooxygenase [Corynebacterium pacaense]
MITVNIRFLPKAKYVDNFRQTVNRFTEEALAEEGCLFFDWFRSTDNPSEYLLLAAFTEDGARVHRKSPHFIRAMESLPPMLQQTPQVIQSSAPGKKDWDRLHEFQVY